MKPTIFYDESGDLRDGYFYCLEIPFSTSDVRSRGNSHPRFVYMCRDSDYPDCYSDVLFDSEIAERCLRDKSHIVKKNRINYRADIFGGSPTEVFVSDSHHQTIVMMREFGDRINATELSGKKVLPLTVRENQANAKEPNLCRLELLGSDCIRPQVVRVPEPNVCPYCRKSSVICPQCLDVNYECPGCSRELFSLPCEKRNTPFLMEGLPAKGRIIDGKRWDGSDFIMSAIEAVVTGRTISWLIHQHATSFTASALRVDVTGMSAEMLEKLDAVKFTTQK